MEVRKLRGEKREEITVWPFVRWIESRERWMVDARTKNGGERRFFRSKPEAVTWRQIQIIQRQNEGDGAFDGRALAEFGWTVSDAIKFSLDHLRKKATSIPLTDAVERLLAAKVGVHRSPEYVSDLRRRLKKLTAVMGSQSVAGITVADVEAFLSGLGVAPETQNTVRRDCGTLWAYCVKQGWAVENVVMKVDRAKVIDKPPGILTPAEATALMAASKDADVRAFHAIGLFAGLRVAEIKKLDWSNVDLAGGFIHVSAESSKTRARRLVPILDNLRSWLTPLARTKGPVIPAFLRKRQQNARIAAGITNWPDNCMRHSFVSYRLAATGNAAQTALESGHDQAVLFRHYRELVRPKEATAYFKIKPLRKTYA